MGIGGSLRTVYNSVLSRIVSLRTRKCRMYSSYSADLPALTEGAGDWGHSLFTKTLCSVSTPMVSLTPYLMISVSYKRVISALCISLIPSSP
jgi:hypothetical protein